MEAVRLSATLTSDYSADDHFQFAFGECACIQQGFGQRYTSRPATRDKPAGDKGAGMNDARRDEIRRALRLIGEAKAILEMVLTREQDDFDNMPEISKVTKQGKERRTISTHWSAPRRAVTTRFLLARMRYRASTSIADEMR